jgi:hypothetical protein
MNKFKYYFFYQLQLYLYFHVLNDDTAEITPPRDFAQQYATDLTDIEEYLKTYSITVVNHPVLQMIKTFLLRKLHCWNLNLQFILEIVLLFKT